MDSSSCSICELYDRTELSKLRADRQHEMEIPEVQSTFADEYHRAKNMLKGLQQDDEDEEVQTKDHPTTLAAA